MGVEIKIPSTPASILQGPQWNSGHSVSGCPSQFIGYFRVSITNFVYPKLAEVPRRLLLPERLYAIRLLLPIFGRKDRKRRTEEPCKLYFPAITALKRHSVEHKSVRRFNAGYFLSNDGDEPANLVNLPLPSDTNDGFLVIENIFEFMQNVYEEA